MTYFDLQGQLVQWLPCQRNVGIVKSKPKTPFSCHNLTFWSKPLALHTHTYKMFISRLNYNIMKLPAAKARLSCMQVLQLKCQLMFTKITRNKIIFAFTHGITFWTMGIQPVQSCLCSPLKDLTLNSPSVMMRFKLLT